MGGLWHPGWRPVAFCGWRCIHPGSPARAAERVELFLRPEWSGTGGAEKGLRWLGTWKHCSLPARHPALQPPRRPKSSDPFTRAHVEEWRQRNKTTLTYVAAVAVAMLGASYAAVPLYRLYCQTTGLGGSAVAGHASDQIENMVPVKDRIIKISFNADVHASLQWNFRPQQTEIYVVPGETALAFYRAKNPTDKPVIGISTYNVVPFEAGQYFNKIQCFCFEEQRLNPQEEVDMPVFFYIDPEFAEDPRMINLGF
ncbi:PREDICTED: cytochrome c oxidase assembly protein COX11, mitochondrial isoform X2 [Colobus angolensis palliatus]|uniref:cytochrome c oxidase assembly protein COX11, mitochondrial isoform X2 n=1 Tax=Colobus angolensis palliatus TaxID=336983 RepID=UPI0005F4EE69|nr:PREDICTED: cytochrome c oxidase assembly protein COX11, mitochondrial isoform X2 [Colobus angolensis palliatus]